MRKLARQGSGADERHEASSLWPALCPPRTRDLTSFFSPTRFATCELLRPLFHHRLNLRIRHPHQQVSQSAFSLRLQQRIRMGLSNFPSAAEGLLPVLVLKTVVSVALLKNMLRSLLQAVGASWNADMADDEQSCVARRRVTITQYKCVSDDGGRRSAMAECCVCLCGFRGSEEVSELSCKHFFHRACLDKWFLNRHPTCPLCRSSS